MLGDRQPEARAPSAEITVAGRGRERCSRRRRTGWSRQAKASAKRRALRIYALLETLYATGLRVSELIGLSRDVLTSDDQVMTIKGKGGRERLVPLNDSARKALADHRRGACQPTRRKAARGRLGCSPPATEAGSI